MATSILWKAIADLDRNVMTPSDIGKSFHPSPSPGVFRRFGLPMDYAYTPLNLELTPTYYQVVARSLSSIGLEVGEKKFPYRVTLPGLGTGRVGVGIHLYPPSTAIATVKFDTAETIADVERLFLGRNLEANHAVRLLVRTSLALVNSENHRELRPVPNQAYPGILLIDSTGVGGFRQWDTEMRKRLVGLLIGTADSDKMSDDIVAHVEASNSQFNKKTTDELLLLNKQSLLLLATANRSRRAIVDRFEHSAGLAEIALAMRAFLKKYPGSRAGVEEFSDYIYWRIRSWVFRYGAIFATSVSNRFLWEHLVREFRLKDLVDAIEADNPWINEELQRQYRFFAHRSRGWWSDPAYAGSFTASEDSPTSQELSFLRDPRLRSVILSDFREANRALEDRSYKSAVVMAGAIAEALLLDALIDRTTLSDQALMGKSLSQYIGYARDRDLGIDEGVLTVVDQAMRAWRNLVHPGRQVRLSATVDEHKARMAINAMHALAAELAK